MGEHANASKPQIRRRAVCSAMGAFLLCGIGLTVALPAAHPQAVAALAQPAGTWHADTTEDFALPQGQTYTFSVWSDRPADTLSFSTGNGEILAIERVEAEAGRYAVTVRATGEADEAAGFYAALGDGTPQRVCTVTVEAAPALSCDTTEDFTLAQNRTYTFQVTVTGTGAAPVFSTGSGDILKIESTAPDAEKPGVYTCTVRAAGQPGQSAGVYAALDGGTPQKLCAVEVAAVQPGEAPESLRLDVPYRSQEGLLPTGCELISAMMLMDYYGFPVTVDAFLSNVDTGTLTSRDGALYGPSPDEAFIGSPYSASGFGCFPPVIVRALQRQMPGYTVRDTTGTPLDALARTYLPEGEPVLIWATINLVEPYAGDSWIVSSTGERFTWPACEHCLVLVGYDAEGYWVNDPYESNGVVHYDKARLEERFSQLGQRSVTVLKP